ncbi:MAG: CHAP domain-containing protein [Deltaproteobacteria bacterium]|nr:CHAP domain-containing protein [Deltaproteobacteria bacterium]
MTLKQFIDKWLGETADWDGKYGGQCVDLFRYYCHEVLGIGQPNPVNGAADFWSNYSSDPKLHGQFYKIPNTLKGVPEYGDVVVWSSATGGGYGHIGIYLSGNVNAFASLDQNWPLGAKVRKVPHSYNDVLGWLRPKNQAAIGSP